MGVNVQGVEELMWMLKRAGNKAAKGALDQMRKEAEDIRDTARRMAPVDEGDLEKAIVTREVGGGRSESGRFTSKSIVIEVNGDIPAGVDREGRVRTVGDYAYLMHEHLTPYGHFRLGPKSQAKQAGQKEIVGGKYLERALEAKQDGLVDRVIERVRRELSKD
jgi:hypothetical protein